MQLYDAKNPQKCILCGFGVSHNKQGRFTSHIINKHNLTLEDYLLKYHYNPEDIKCSYELCEGVVRLYRGKPKQYCSKICSLIGRATPLKCVVCNKKFDTKTRPHRQTKTCGRICERKLRSIKTKKWHQSMDEKMKSEHFNNIISKTAKTRKKNKTPSWNSGKTGIYSEETIQKIRSSVLKQMENHVFKKTKIEKVIEEYLVKIEVKYKYSFILQNRQYDFLLTELDILIECDGDYWHANPMFYPEPKDWQVERIKIDQEKDEIARINGYQIVRFWENDILNNFNYVKSVINDLLATT